MSVGRCGIPHPEHSHLECSMRAGHSGGHSTNGAVWPRRAPVTPPVEVAGREVRVGDRVRVLGRHQCRRVSMYVAQVVELDDGGRLLVGYKRRGATDTAGVARVVEPLTRVEVLP